MEKQNEVLLTIDADTAQQIYDTVQAAAERAHLNNGQYLLVLCGLLASAIQEMGEMAPTGLRIATRTLEQYVNGQKQAVVHADLPAEPPRTMQ